jgi:hypothetical protein
MTVQELLTTLQRAVEQHPDVKTYKVVYQHDGLRPVDWIQNPVTTAPERRLVLHEDIY